MRPPFNSRSHVAIALAVSLGVLLAGCAPAGAGPETLHDPVPQSRSEREIREFFGGVIDTLGLVDDEAGEEAGLFQPMAVIVDDQDAVFVLDRGRMRINKYDRSGRFVRSFGKGGGQGPGEFNFLMAFALNGAGEVIALDGQANLVTRFDSLGNVSNRLLLPRPGIGIAAVGDDVLAIRFTGPGSMFGLFDSEGRATSDATGPATETIEEAFPLIGQMTGAGPDGFVFSPHYSGSILGLDSSLRLRYHVQSIEPSPMPRVDGGDESLSLNTKEARGFYMPVSATADTLYTVFFSRSAQAGYLDVYSNADGTYAYSAELPEACAPAYVSASHAYLICNQTDVMKVERLSARTSPDVEVL